MLRTRSIHWLFVLSAMTLVALVGCSDSDPTLPVDDDTARDTTGPLVVSLLPNDKDIGVGLSSDIIVSFNEPMDQDAVESALTLSTGPVGDVTWNDAGTVATVSHQEWAEGETVVLTVDAAAADLAGNTMPQAFSSTFYTYSSAPVMLDYDFLAPLDEVPLTGYFEVNFSEAMDLSSLLSAYTLTAVGPKDVSTPGVIVSTTNGDYRRVTFRWDGQLTPLVSYQFSISTAAMTSQGENLSEGFTISFTAGTEIDTTPPYIVSTTPALDAVVDPDLDTIVITFNERIDTEYRSPSDMAALLDIFAAREPVWNDAGDEITVYLNGPLPEGVRLYAIWPESELRDIAGNFSTGVDSLSFTTSGEASLFPVRQDLRLYYYYYSEGKKIPGDLARQTIENIEGNDFERVLNRLTASGYDDPMEHWYMHMSGSDLMFRGYRDDSSDVMFSPAVTYLPGPLPATWSGSTSIATEDGTITLNYSGTFVETFRERWSADKVSGGVYLDNCVVVDLFHEMRSADSDSLLEEGGDNIYLCPGLGILSLETTGSRYENGQVVENWEDGIYMWGAALDDRNEP